MLKHALVVAALAIPLRAHAQATIDGWRYAMKVTIDSGNGRVISMTARHYVTDRRVRSEVSLSGNGSTPKAPEGTYSVINTDDNSFLTVFPSTNMASLMNRPPSSTIMPTLPKFTARQASTDVIDLGLRRANAWV